MRKYILAVDQGTTSTRAILFDKSGKIVSRVSKEFNQYYPVQGWVEHNPDEIMESVIFVMRAALKEAGVRADEVDSLGITNQRETTIVWDKNTSRPVYNAIVWQCRRTAGICASLREKGYENMICSKTGLVPDAYFSAAKAQWILDNVPNARAEAGRGNLAFGTIDTYIMWQLSKGRIFATDYTNAARTMLFNIHTLRYDKDLLSLFNISENMLPKVCPSSHYYGKIDSSVLGCEIPVMGVAGDQQAALFGQLCFDKGNVKNTYGTGCFLLMNTGDKCVTSKRGLITTLAASGGSTPHYALEGSVFIGGAVVKWLRDEMGLIKKASESEKLAMKVKDNGGVYFVPAFTGLGAPHWDPDARGLICGLTRGTTKAHIVRAALEAVAYEVFDVLHAMERDIGVNISSLSVDGGAAANNFLLSFQADVCQAVVTRPKMLEVTALGACFLAGLKSGFFKSVEELKQNTQIDKTFKPQMSVTGRDKLLAGWGDAILRTKAK